METIAQAVKRNTGIVEDGSPAGQLRRRSAGSRRKRIGEGVDIESLSSFTRKSVSLNKLCISSETHPREAACQPGRVLGKISHDKGRSGAANAYKGFEDGAIALEPAILE